MTEVRGLKAAIFDCDGTLVDSESIWIDMIHDVLKDANLDPTERALEEFRGVTSTVAAEKIATQAGGEVSSTQMALDTEYSRRLKSVSVPMASAVAFLRAFQREIPVAVASNGRREDVVALLTNARLIDFVNEIVTIEDVKQGKPAPDLYVLACERLGANPRQSVVFEDSIVGITAAKRAGCFVIGLGADAHIAEAADHCVPGFDHLGVESCNGEATIRLHTPEYF